MYNILIYFSYLIYIFYLYRVKYAVNTETNEAVAIKILDKDKIQTRNMGAQIKKEISIMKMINHHHVVSVKDVFATSAKIFIVLEFVGGGELFDKIANEGKLPEEKARFYFKQLVDGLSHCHNKGVCHRDLKPEVIRWVLYCSLYILYGFYVMLYINYVGYICIYICIYILYRY